MPVPFVVNFEERGENNILQGDAGSEGFLSDVLGARSRPGRRNPNVASMFECGSRAGFWRLWRGFTQQNVRPTASSFGALGAMFGREGATAQMGSSSARLPARFSFFAFHSLSRLPAASAAVSANV